MSMHRLNRFALMRVLAALVLLLPNVFGLGLSTARASPSCDAATPFHASQFPDPPAIGNPFLPLTPGTQYVLEGTANRGGGDLPHRVVFTITDLTKWIDGVRTLTVWDQDFSGGVLVEEELAFFAQDIAGNVWNLGEYPEEYEDGVFIGAPSTWFSGLAGAVGGVHMLAAPRSGTGYYLQGWAPQIDFLDCAKVFKTGEQVCVPAGCFDGVLVTSEKSPLDQGGGSQLKYHAPGIGIVQIGAVGDPQAETLAMTSRVQLSAGAMAQAREQALRLDRRGYENSDVYRQTPPAERLR